MRFENEGGISYLMTSVTQEFIYTFGARRLSQVSINKSTGHLKTVVGAGTLVPLVALGLLEGLPGRPGLGLL